MWAFRRRYPYSLDKATMTLIEILSALEEAQKDPNPPLTKQKTKFASLNVVVEYPKGSIRELKDDEGKVVFKKFMSYPYGYLANTKGRDTDEVDVILGTNQNCKQVFVAHMKDMGPDKDEREDEDKVMLGFTDYNSALI